MLDTFCSLCNLYNWRYKKLGNLPHVSQLPEYQAANAGFAFDYQLIDVQDFNGVGESEPNPYFYQVQWPAPLPARTPVPQLTRSLRCWLHSGGQPADKYNLLNVLAKSASYSSNIPMLLFAESCGSRIRRGGVYVYEAAWLSGGKNLDINNLQRTKASYPRCHRAALHPEPRVRAAVEDHHRRSLSGTAERLHTTFARAHPHRGPPEASGAHYWLESFS